MQQTLLHQALANSRLLQQIDSSLFENTGANALLNIFTRAAFQHHGRNAFQMQQMRERQSRRPRANNSHLRPHDASLPARKYRETQLCCRTKLQARSLRDFSERWRKFKLSRQSVSWRDFADAIAHAADQ
jgi:hypothetical protein